MISFSTYHFIVAFPFPLQFIGHNFAFQQVFFLLIRTILKYIICIVAHLLNQLFILKYYIFPTMESSIPLFR